MTKSSLELPLARNLKRTGPLLLFDGMLRDDYVMNTYMHVCMYVYCLYVRKYANTLIHMLIYIYLHLHMFMVWLIAVWRIIKTITTKINTQQRFERKK